MVILAELIHVGVSVDVGTTKGTVEVAIFVIARGAAESSATVLRPEAVVVTGLNTVSVHLSSH